MKEAGCCLITDFILLLPKYTENQSSQGKLNDTIKYPPVPFVELPKSELRIPDIEKRLHIEQRMCNKHYKHHQKTLNI